MKKNLLVLLFIGISKLFFAQWQMQLQNNISSQDPRIKMVNSQKGYFSNNDFIFKTTNGGQTWIKIDSALGFSTLGDMQIINDSTVITLFTGNSNSSYVRVTNNSGATWQSSSVITNNVILNAVEFTSLTNGIVCGNMGKIYRTTNAGLSWTQINPPVSANFEQMQFANSSVGYIIGSASVILKTTNGGATWTSLNFPSANQQHYQLDFLNQDTGMVASSGGIARTYNGGSTWNTVYSGQSMWSIEYVGQDTLYAAGSQKFIMRSSDGGTSWDTLNYIVGQNPYQTDFLNGNLGWCATAGSGLYKTNSGAFSCPQINFTTNSPDTICANSTAVFGSTTDFITNICPVTVTPGPNAFVSNISTNGNYTSVYGGSNQNFTTVYFIITQNNSAIGCPSDADTIYAYSDSNSFAPAIVIPTSIDSACVGDTLHMGSGAYEYVWIGQSFGDTLSTNEYVVVTQNMLGGLIHPQAKLCNGWNNYYLFLYQDQNCLTTNTPYVGTQISSFTLVPNPAHLTFLIKNSSGNLYHVKIYDISGREILSFQNVMKDLEIESINLESGLYSIICEEQGQVIVKKLLINHD